jgi:hypothetical protein
MAAQLRCTHALVRSILTAFLWRSHPPVNASRSFCFQLPHSVVGVPPTTRLWKPESTKTGEDGASWIAFHGSLARLSEADEGVEAFNRLNDDGRYGGRDAPKPQVAEAAQDAATSNTDSSIESADVTKDASSNTDSSGESESELDEDERELAELERRERELAEKVAASGSRQGGADASNESAADEEGDEDADLRELEALEKRAKELASQLGQGHVDDTSDDTQTDDDDMKELAELEELEKKLRGELEQRKRSDL